MTKSVLMAGDRVWTGPARGLRVEGSTSLRVRLGLYEVELNKWIRRLVTPGTAVFDVGAQYGFEALMFARLSADAPVLTVEGDAELRALIQGNIVRNGFEERITIRTGWVGDGSGDTISLDSLAMEHFVPGFIKLDIEGAEGSAIAGAQEMLSACDRWLVETHGLPQENACLQAFALRGFKVEIVAPRRWLPDHRPMAHNRWLIATRGI